jgi:hypothetical protein
MYVCLYLYVYLFYCVYCVPCTANRKPVCIFTCGLLTFTEARRDRTTAHRLRPACRPDAESLGAAQCRCRLPCPVASPPLNGCRCVPGPQPVHTARPVHTPTRQQKAKVYALPLYAESAPCNRKSHPACMRGGQSANNLQTTGAGVTPSNNTRKPCRSWENARPQRLQKMPFGAPNAPIDQLCGQD